MMTTTFKSLVIIAAFLLSQKTLSAQVINWENVSRKDKHLLHAAVGAAYGLTAGLGYHRLVPIHRFPLWMGAEVSIPAGRQLADDFTGRLGAQIRLLTMHHVQFSARVQGITRQYHNQSVTLFNFGSDMAGVLGYYRTNWFLGAEAGFDKAIVTHFKHSDWYRKNIYADVQDGWYEPATGGNFYYGLQGGYVIKKTDLTLKAGRMLQQDFKSRPLLPFYAQLGVNFRL